MPIAATAAVSLTYFGDGAANQGQVYESFNMAALWKLPVVYVIENNRYAMGTVGESRLGPDRFLQARPLLQHSRRTGRRHGCARRLRGAARSAIEHARSGKGPYILEMLTYRYRGHSMSDPAKYRSKDEVQKHARRARSDRTGPRTPAGRVHRASEEELKKIDAEGPRDRQRRRRFRHDDPEPDPSGAVDRHHAGKGG